jgi:hypothetical protein
VLFELHLDLSLHEWAAKDAMAACRPEEERAF